MQLAEAFSSSKRPAMASADPLLALRKAISSGSPISLLGADGSEVFDLKQCTDISLGPGLTFAKLAPTRFLSNDKDSIDDPAAPTYDLGTLLFSYNEKDTATGAYMRQVPEAGVSFVSFSDRKLVNDFLRGAIPADGPEGRVRPLPGSAKRAAGEAAGADAAGGAGAPPQKKQRYVPNREDQERVKRILQIVEGPQYGHIVGPGEVKLEKTGAVYHNRETVLRGERINVRLPCLAALWVLADFPTVRTQNFESVRALIGPRLKQLRAEQQQKQPAQQSVAPVPAKPQKKKQLNPIIIISPSSTALITMHNVKQFLEEGRCVRPKSLCFRRRLTFRCIAASRRQKMHGDLLRGTWRATPRRMSCRSATRARARRWAHQQGPKRARRAIS